MNDYPRCETCKHWKPDNAQEWGDCMEIARRRGIAELDKELVSFDRGFYGDGTLETRRNFGCILHQPRP